MVSQERDLRVFAWWRRNDALRDPFQQQDQEIMSDSGPWRENLEALANLLTEENVNDCIMKAEVLRELGEFESAKELLSRVDSPNVARAVRRIRSLCDARDTRVREL